MAPDNNEQDILNSDWPWDDEEEIIVVPDDGNDEMPFDYDPYLQDVEYGYDGVQATIWNGINNNFITTNDFRNTFTELVGGFVSFGEISYDNIRTVRCSIQPTILDTYTGITINSPYIHINTNFENDYRTSSAKLDIGSYTGLTGYLRAMVELRVTQSDGPMWVIKNIPFINGICVMS